ncbi:MAG TPA: DUF362 domain-containing protein [Acidobacteriota bacterium]|nr:DUF362 domain-containing protein [Acidobacteriota bacterium]
MDAPRVVVIRAKGLPTGDISAGTMRRMYEAGIRILTGESDPNAGLRRLFGPGDRVGIKINAIGGKLLSTRPDVSLPLASWLAEKTVKPGSVVVWDRTNRELKGAGYRLSSEGSGPRVFGTDTDGAGYGRELVVHRDIGSLFSSIQEDYVTASISLAVLKDHGMAGVTAGMKNYFGAIHNPNKYHDGHCDPYVADVFDAPVVKGKHRLTILDALTVQYHRGPSYHPQWAERAGALVFGIDPVATDAVGWRFIESLRAKKGLPSLAEEHREPSYLATAEKLGLGTADPSRISLVEVEV